MPSKNLLVPREDLVVCGIFDVQRRAEPVRVGVVGEERVEGEEVAEHGWALKSEVVDQDR
jgi:hypothetical protein